MSHLERHDALPRPPPWQASGEAQPATRSIYLDVLGLLKLMGGTTKGARRRENHYKPL